MFWIVWLVAVSTIEPPRCLGGLSYCEKESVAGSTASEEEPLIGFWGLPSTLERHSPTTRRTSRDRVYSARHFLRIGISYGDLPGPHRQ